MADFSSAVDEGAMAAGLYGVAGPAQGEETLQYAPPEVLFNPEVRCGLFCWRDASGTETALLVTWRCTRLYTFDWPVRVPPSQEPARTHTLVEVWGVAG